MSRKGNEFQPPQKLDYFIVTTLDRGEDGNYIADPQALQLFGDKPTSLPVRLLFDDVEGNFSSRYVAFVGNKQWCAGDGVEATRQSTSGPVKVECPCPRIAPDYQGNDKCKFNGALSVIIDGMPGVGGVWKFRTTSYNSTVNLMSSLALIKRVTGGVLSGIPLNLVLHAKQTTSPDGKQQTVYIVSLEYPGTIDELRELGLERLKQDLEHRVEVAKLETAVRRLLLPSPGGPLDGDDEDEIAREFYPANVDPATGEVLDAKPASDPVLDKLLNEIAPPPVNTDPPAAPPSVGDAPADESAPPNAGQAGARPLSSYAATVAGVKAYLKDLTAAFMLVTNDPDAARAMLADHDGSLKIIEGKTKDALILGNVDSIRTFADQIINPPQDDALLNLMGAG